MKNFRGKRGQLHPKFPGETWHPSPRTALLSSLCYSTPHIHCPITIPPIIVLKKKWFPQKSTRGQNHGATSKKGPTMGKRADPENPGNGGLHQSIHGFIWPTSPMNYTKPRLSGGEERRKSPQGIDMRQPNLHEFHVPTCVRFGFGFTPI